MFIKRKKENRWGANHINQTYLFKGFLLRMFFLKGLIQEFNP